MTEPGVTSDFEQTRTTLSASGAMTGGPPYLDMPFRRTRYVEDRPLAPVLAGALRPADSIRRRMPRAGPEKAAGSFW
ncbi:MAG TPA: hypothetical protein VNZ53_44020, partial [Steroidobacteraceae bacterium]|nr:hypothetical protein [Steroidobacteraceae bacterium]